MAKIAGSLAERCLGFGGRPVRVCRSVSHWHGEGSYTKHLEPRMRPDLGDDLNRFIIIRMVAYLDLLY